MARQLPKLVRIEHNEQISADTHSDFFYQLHRALLLSLREQGILTLMQYRQAEESLKHQRVEHAAKRKLEEL